MFCIGSSLLVASGYYWVLFQCLKMEKTKTSFYAISQWNSLVYSLCLLVSPQGVFSPLFSFECGLKISFLILVNWSLTVTAFRSVNIHRCYGYIGDIRILQSLSFDVYLPWTLFVLLPVTVLRLSQFILICFILYNLVFSPDFCVLQNGFLWDLSVNTPSVAENKMSRKLIFAVYRCWCGLSTSFCLGLEM